MNKKLYNLMDWAAIEEIVYAESIHPENILGARNTGNNTLVQCFFPGANSVELCIKGGAETIKMEEADEAGFYAALIPGKDKTDYEYHVLYKGKKKPVVKKEVYSNYLNTDNKEFDKLNESIVTDVQNILGAHVIKKNGVQGINFAVYAPNALRVSVVGDFNDFDGKIHQMIKHDESGVFELFIPDLSYGIKYQYEILIKGAELLRKNDPFAKAYVKMDDQVYSVLEKTSTFKWSDDSFVKNRTSERLRVYEICESTYADVSCLKELTAKVVKHMKDYGYTHVELMPLFASFNDSLGYKPSFLFAVNRDISDEKDLKYFVNELHANNLGVILQMPFACFDDGPASFGYFDGSCLYEHEDYRKGIDPRTGARIYQYGNYFVKNMLLSSASYFVKEFHLDGIKLCNINSMLYLDYYRNPNEWVPNENGSNENYEAASFIRALNDLLHKSYNNIITIADEESGWNGITSADDNNSLGFNYVLNTGFTKKLITYLGVDPINRSSQHDVLISLFDELKKERYIAAITNSDVDFGKGGVVTRLFGDESRKMSEYKLLMAMLMASVNNISIFMGQDFADYSGFDGHTCLLDQIEADDVQNNVSLFIKDIIKLMNKYDYSENVLSIIAKDKAVQNVIVFTLNNKKDKTELMLAFNFADCVYDKFKVSVPLAGKYQEIYSSDRSLYGGQDILNKRVLPSKKDIMKDENIVYIKLGALSLSVFKYTAFSKEELAVMDERDKERQRILADRQKLKADMIREKENIKNQILSEMSKKVLEANKKVFN